MPDTHQPLDTARSLDAELELRLEEVSRPENQGEGLRRGDLVVLTAITIVAPAAALALGWSL